MLSGFGGVGGKQWVSEASPRCLEVQEVTGGT